MTTSIDALAGIAAIDQANEQGVDVADVWDANQVSDLTGSPTGSTSLDNISVLNVGPTVGLYNKKNPATAATSEGLYPGRKKAMELLGITYGTKAYKDWDAKTRALMGVKKGDKFSSGQWIQAFGQMTPDQINKAEPDYLSSATKAGLDKLSPSLMSAASIPSAASMKQFYLDDQMASTKLNPVTHIKDRPVSGWAAPWQLMSEEAITRKVLDEATQATGTGEMHPLMVAGLKYGLNPGQIAKIAETQNQDVWGSYWGWDDTMKMNIHPGAGYPAIVQKYGTKYDTEEHQLADKLDWVGTPFHEIAGHRLLNQLEWESYGQSHYDYMTKRQQEDVESQMDTFSATKFDQNTPWGVKRADFLSQQLPDVQKMYETGGSQISPGSAFDFTQGYGFDPTQGEMVTSRAATVENLLNLNAPIHARSGPYSSGWEDLASFMEKQPIDWKTDFNPNVNLTNLEELGYDPELARQYEAWERFNQELPPAYLGGDPSSPVNVTYDLFDTLGKSTGLAGWPLGHHHFLVDRIIARNPKLFSGEKKGLKRALTNEINAALAKPESTLNKLSKLGLADQFWDYVEDYLSRESDDWSPSQARKEIQKLLGE